MQLTELHWSLQSGLPFLFGLQALPLLVALILMLNMGRMAATLLAVVMAVAEFTIAIIVYLLFDPALPAYQFSEYYDLLPPLSYHAGVDGMGIIFVLLTAFLTLMLIFYAIIRTRTAPNHSLAVIFTCQGTLMMMFTTLDMLWFLIASIAHLGFIAYLLKEWSTSPDQDRARSQFLQFMGVGLLLLAAGTFMLGWNHFHIAGYWSFDLFELATTEIPNTIETLIFFLIFYGLAIRVPLFPFHGWLPSIAEHGTIAVAGVFLIGLKTGIFGMLRFVLPVMPDAVIQWQYYIVAFAGAGVFYAALLALLQNNLRRLIAYAVVSHTSVLVIGLFSLEDIAFQGSVMLAINFGLATSILLFMTGTIFQRTHSMLFSRLGGLFDHMPVIGIAFFIAGLSIIGMPGTPGFDAVHLLLEASMKHFGALPTVAAALGNVAAAGFLLWGFQKAFLSPRAAHLPTLDSTQPIRLTERLLAISMILVLLISGFYTEPWLQLIEASMTDLGGLYHHD